MPRYTDTAGPSSSSRALRALHIDATAVLGGGIPEQAQRAVQRSADAGDAMPLTPLPSARWVAREDDSDDDDDMDTSDDSHDEDDDEKEEEEEVAGQYEEIFEVLSHRRQGTRWLFTVKWWDWSVSEVDSQALSQEAYDEYKQHLRQQGRTLRGPIRNLGMPIPRLYILEGPRPSSATGAPEYLIQWTDKRRNGSFKYGPSWTEAWKLTADEISQYNRVHNLVDTDEEPDAEHDPDYVMDDA